MYSPFATGCGMPEQTFCTDPAAVQSVPEEQEPLAFGDRIYAPGGEATASNLAFGCDAELDLEVHSLNTLAPPQQATES